MCINKCINVYLILYFVTSLNYLIGYDLNKILNKHGVFE